MSPPTRRSGPTATGRATREISRHHAADRDQRSAAGRVCDFCTGPLRRTWSRFGCRTFSHSTPAAPGATIVVTYFDHWAACRRCAPLVREQRWREVANRAIVVRRAAGDPVADRPATRTEIAGLLLALEAHLTGEETTGREASR